MKYTKIFDSHYENLVIGYKPEFEGYAIYKDSHLTWCGTEITDGWEVIKLNQTGFYGKREFYGSTLKEAKAWFEKNIVNKNI